MERRPTIFRDGLLIVLAYMAVRHAVYLAFPVHSPEQWSQRDALMCLPRTAAFVALWACNAAWWGGAVPFGWARPGALLPAVSAGLLLVGAEALHLFGWGKVAPYPLPLALVGLAATVPVVLFEEYAFRGAILEGLRRRLGNAPALLLSALLFTVFHIEAQPFGEWPAIFLIGLALGGLRLRGCGLGWLAVVHFGIDALYFAFTDPPAPIGVDALLRHGLLLLAAVLAWPWPRRKIAAS